MGPVAKKLIAEIEKHRRMGDEPDVVQTIRRPGPIEVPKDVAPSVFVWMRAYQYLVKIASGIMGSHTLKKFTKKVRLIDEEYLPHGPPDSPITDSFFFGWWAIDQPVGKNGETIASIAADLAHKYGGSEDDIDRIRTLADTHLRVVRVEEREGALARLVDVVTGDQIEVGLAAPWEGQLWLARALPDMCFTPYALDGDDAEAEWRAYFERTLGEATGDQLKDRYRTHMRGDPENLWLEYILDGYDSGTEHTLHLRGVPDRPETLPHSSDQLALLDGVPLDDARDHLTRELLLTDLLVDALGDFMAARESFELPEIEPDEDMLLDPMLMAYASYGLVQDDGRTFLESFLAEQSARRKGRSTDERSTELSREIEGEQLADLRAIEAGWFSMFEVLHVKLDEGMELHDLLRKKKVWVEERSATRQIALGDLLAGWVQDYGDRITLEGCNLHFPRLMAPPIKGFIEDYYANLGKDVPWKQRLASIVPVVAGLHETMRERPPVPAILNEDGEEIVFSQGRYLLKADVCTKLIEAGWEGDDGSFVLFEGERLLASAEIDGERLTLFATSPAQLADAKTRLEELLGGDAVHQNDVFEDAQVAVRESLADELPEPEKLSVEMQEELRAFLEEELKAWLDSPNPMLGDRTPREAVRTKRGKEDVKMMLLEQERMLDQEQLDEPVDFRPLWASLGLEYPS